MNKIYFYDEKLLKCGREIERLQLELSEQQDINNELKFQLSTLRFLEQQTEYDHHKIEENNEERDRERMDFQAKLARLAKDFQEQKDMNIELAQLCKSLQDQQADLEEQLTKEQSKRVADNENLKKEISFFQNENRIIRQKQEEDKLPKIVRADSCNSPGALGDTNRKLNQQEKLVYELTEWKEKFANERLDKERQCADFQDLVIQKLKKEEEFQKSIRDWQTKYDWAMKQIDEKEESFTSQLDDKLKEIRTLQQKLYSNQKSQVNQECQTDELITHYTKQSSISLILENESVDDEFITTFRQLQQFTVEEIQEKCIAIRHNDFNPLWTEINRMVKFQMYQVPYFAQVELERVRQLNQALEKQISTLYDKWKQQKDINKTLFRRQSRKIASQPFLDYEQDLQCGKDDQAKLAQKLHSKCNDYHERINELATLLDNSEKEKSELSLSHQQKQKELQQQINQLQQKNMKHNTDLARLQTELSKALQVKQKLKNENADMLKDLEKLALELQRKKDIVVEIKAKNEELVKLNETLNKKLDAVQNDAKQQQKSIEELEQENFQAEQQLQSYVSQVYEYESKLKEQQGKQKTVKYFYKGAYEE